jgi:hypothetical protein
MYVIFHCMEGSFEAKLRLLFSEGQETGAIAPAPENARKKIEGRGLSRPLKKII